MCHLSSLLSDSALQGRIWWSGPRGCWLIVEKTQTADMCDISRITKFMQQQYAGRGCVYCAVLGLSDVLQSINSVH